MIARLDKQSHKIIVDLATHAILSDKVYNGHGYPLLTYEEQLGTMELPQTYKPFIESIERRGLNLSEVVCSTFTIGWFGELKCKRVLKVLCFYVDGPMNLYVRPMEGITLVVDIDEMKIVEYYDMFIVPVPKAEEIEYKESKLEPPFVPRLNGATLVNLDGLGFKIHGHTVRSVFFVFYLNVFFREILHEL